MDTSKFSVEAYQKMGAFIAERAVDDLQAQTNGICLVVDLGRLTLSKMFRLCGLRDMNRGIAMWQGAFPCKLKRVFLLNVSFVTAGAVHVAKKLLTQKLARRCLPLRSAATPT
eukprot:TRINITY_DN13787_c0_g1_i2.p3 TRINITY_DN13787_c0_g1~~TRINITY_DN13787_c0_g1_i2.p3  ORF type:complete len:113 (-),score=21.32 TRINITY_DN13787_c0_g1_i2:464-802(-)